MTGTLYGDWAVGAQIARPQSRWRRGVSAVIGAARTIGQFVVNFPKLLLRLYIYSLDIELIPCLIHTSVGIGIGMFIATLYYMCTP